MKKIAILTWIHYTNFGSVLQAYALGEFLSSNGYLVEYINYKPIKMFPTPLKKRLFDREDVIRKIRAYFEDGVVRYNEDIIKKDKLFARFVEERFKLTEPCNTESELAKIANKYDCIICGSDQIWSPIIFDEKYYLSFTNGKKVNAVAYAPSIGTDRIIDSNVRSLMTKALENITVISTREDSGAKLIKMLTQRDAEIVVDPTLLLDRTKWEYFAQSNESIECDRKYMLVYLLGSECYYNKYIEAARKLNYEIVIIPVNKHDYNRDGLVVKNCTPENFVHLIKNAACVCTDSFHGTVFSTIFDIPFITLARFKEKSKINQNERLHTLLKLLKQEERFTYYYDKRKLYLLEKKITKTDLLNFRISSSKKYLLQAIETDSKKKVSFKITETCSGCGTCAVVCPAKAISIEKNQFGFYQSMVNIEKCISCSQCVKVCGFNNKSDNIVDSEVYSFRTKSKEILATSSSGGFAAEVSKLLLLENYEIIGCEYDYEKEEARHIVVDNLDDARKLAGSKYIQSHIEHAIQSIQLDKKYLFIGTPCQVASLDNFLKMRGARDNFILIDLICHGIPSYNLWFKYLSYIKRKYLKNEKVTKVSFRKKISQDTNNNMNMYIESEHHSVCLPQNKDLFLKFFCIGMAYNKSCYNCNFRTCSSADLRIGDYWGTAFKKYPGTSMIICLTAKGKELLKKLPDCSQINLGQWNDYALFQQTENINPPNFHYDLLNKLSEDDTLLEEIYDIYCKDYYFLDEFKRILRKIIKK